MKKLLYFLILSSTATAAQLKGSFVTSNFRVYIPSNLPGIMTDASATMRDDTLVYDLKGKQFGDEGVKIIRIINHSMSTPLETISELVDAYAKKDKERIVSIYNSSSKDQVSAYINSSEGIGFLDYVYKAANANIKILAVIEYLDGYIVFVKDNIYGSHMNYLVNEGGTYKLSILDDKKPTSWNINVYFSTGPKPLIPIQHVMLPDSLGINDSLRVSLPVAEGGRWIAIYSGNVGEAIPLLVQDNGHNDLDPALKKISFYLPGSIFIHPGIHSFYIAAFNYPVNVISSGMLKPVARHTIRIFE